MKDFLKLLFSEEACGTVGKTQYETEVIKLQQVEGNAEDYQFVTLNELTEGKSRADRNVTCFRNFLLEFDNLPIDEQMKVLDDVPYLTVTFSGSKSCHAIISLEEPLSSREEYDHLVKWILEAVPGADKACKNPSRFTRLAGGVNQRTGRKQELLKTGKRISVKDLKEWLSSRVEEPAEEEDRNLGVLSDWFSDIQKSGYRGKLHPATKKFIKTGGMRGNRHRSLFLSACNLRDNFYTIDEAKFLLTHRLKIVYTKEGREYEMDNKLKAIEDAYSHEPQTPFKDLAPKVHK